MPSVPLAGEMGALASGPDQTPRPCANGQPDGPWAASLRLPRVLRPFSRLISALQGIRNGLRDVTDALRILIAIQKEMGPSNERLDVLERERHQFEAMCEGLLLKAEGKLRSANNAEARTRADKKSYEHLVDPLAEDGLETEAPGRHPDSGNDVAASEAERLSALRLDVAPTNKQLAQRAKFGVR